MSGQRIIDSLKEAAAGQFARVTIDGQTWTQEPGWQPIETAPKDGTTVLLWNGDWVVAAFGADDELGLPPEWYALANARRGLHGWGEPTHWMPLPEPPQEQEEAS